MFNEKKLPARGEKEIEAGAEIERLKIKHPDITRAEYWNSCAQAIEAESKITAIFESLRDGKSLESVYLDDAAKLQLTDYLSQSANLRPLNVLISKLDEIKLYIPELPSPGEANKYFAAEDLGVPKLFPGALIISDDVWRQVFPEDETVNIFDDEGECASQIVEAATTVKASNFKGVDNPFAVLGLAIVNSDKSRNILRSTLHEDVHRSDFLIDHRLGLDHLLAEIIAFRITDKLDKPGLRKKRLSQFRQFIDDFAVDYCQNLKIDYSEAQAKINLAMEAISKLEESLSFERVTAIMLNALSFDEIINLSDQIE